jgi:hypothetical protein
MAATMVAAQFFAAKREVAMTGQGPPYGNAENVSVAAAQGSRPRLPKAQRRSRPAG